MKACKKNNFNSIQLVHLFDVWVIAKIFGVPGWTKLCFWQTCHFSSNRGNDGEAVGLKILWICLFNYGAKQTIRKGL